MKRFIFALVLSLVVASLLPAGAAAATPTTTPGATAIPDQYIVVMRQGRDARAAADRAGVVPGHLYTAALNGFAARLDATQLRAVQNDPTVEYIEQDREVSLADAPYTQQMDANGDPWGLDRIDAQALPLSGTYSYTSTGAVGAPPVHAYIIDSGIKTTHPDFEGRAQVAYDAFGGNGQDCQGHGTHVAGTVGGKTYGVAKKVRLHGVRVFECKTKTSVTKILAGVEWVTAYSIKPAVANMSLGVIGNSSSLNSAVNSLIGSGVFVAVAAGNDRIDACTVSPAKVPAAYTVAASDKTDTPWVNPQKKGEGSNYGECVDTYAPGANIKSANYILATPGVIKSGTSMAAPHVAGVAVLLLDHHPNWTPGQITNWLDTYATPGVIKGNPITTPNRLLNKSRL